MVHVGKPIQTYMQISLAKMFNDKKLCCDILYYFFKRYFLFSKKIDFGYHYNNYSLIKHVLLTIKQSYIILKDETKQI